MASFSQPSSQYNQEVKKECRSRLIEHAVRCLTVERDTSACVQRDHVERVWKQLHESGEAQHYFSTGERQEIEAEIKQWELFHDSQVQTRKPSDLRVCYLGGDNPINDLEVLIQNGVLCQNVWAIEKDSKTLQEAWQSINQSSLRNVRLFKGDILSFLKDFEGQFDIIYFDACGTLPAAKQNTLKVIGYVFLYNKLTSPGSLITNFSFPPKRPKQPEDAVNVEPPDEERDRIRCLSGEYLKYRLLNTLRDDNFPDYNAEYLSERTDEENYSDYVTYQVIDLAYLFIPTQRMLLSTGKSLWDQMFVSRGDFLKELKTYKLDRRPFFLPVSTENQSTEATESKSLEEKLQLLRKNIKPFCEDEAITSWLRNIGADLESAKQSNNLCKAWVNEIFPDWQNSPLKKEEISLLLLTPLLFSSHEYILTFSNYDFRAKCLGPLLKACDGERGKFPSCCDVATSTHTTCMVGGLLFGQMAYPSFPVIDKLLRLNYTAKGRKMFSDVFIFDKCRYLYEQFPSVDCACFAIVEPKQQMVFRMVVDGLRKHLRAICEEDVFQCCNTASINHVVDGGVDFPNSWQVFPNRQPVEFLLLKEKANGLVKAAKYTDAVEIYDECLVLCPENAVIFANIAHCQLKLNLPANAKDSCNEALRLDPENVKARYRRAMAFKMMKDYSKAVEDLEKVLRNDKDNKDAERLLSECENLRVYSS